MNEKEIQEQKAKQRARLENAVMPTHGSGNRCPREIHRNPVTAPEWMYWPAERSVETWQAVSLSLGLDPNSLEHRGGAFGESEVITAESFPSADTQDEFRKRIDLLGALSEKVYAPLSHFVALLGNLPMPPELAMLAVAPINPPSNAAPLETKPETGDEPQKVDVGDTAASGDQQQPTDEPKMRVGSNPATSYKPWIEWQARKLTKGSTDKMSALAGRIIDLANERNYRNQSGDAFTKGAVVRLLGDLAPGITGTRSKNGRKAGTSRQK